jgi:endonuclease YncB( thermonuclease family)
MRKEVSVCIHALLLLALCLPAPAAQQVKTIAGKVVGVADGDTITVLDSSKILSPPLLISPSCIPVRSALLRRPAIFFGRPLCSC